MVTRGTGAAARRRPIMKTLLPADVLLILLGAGFAWTAISGTGALKPTTTTTIEAPAAPDNDESRPRRAVLLEGGLAGLMIAAGFVAIGIGAGHWRHPRWSHTRPANPYSDQTGR